MPVTTHKSPEFADVCTPGGSSGDPAHLPDSGAQDEVTCPKCGGSTGFVDCWNCGGEGLSDHDCGEDCCCCLEPELNVECDICDGAGGWRACFTCNPGAFDD